MMTYYLKDIDDVKEADIPDQIYDGAIDSIRNSILHSTRFLFSNYPYYK